MLPFTIITVCTLDKAVIILRRCTIIGACLAQRGRWTHAAASKRPVAGQRVAFVEHSPYAEEARHRFLRTSQALWMLCRNLLPGPEAPTWLRTLLSPPRCHCHHAEAAGAHTWAEHSSVAHSVAVYTEHHWTDILCSIICFRPRAHCPVAPLSSEKN